MKLTLKKIKQKQAGKGLAAIDRQTLEALGIESGDYVQVVGDDDSTILRAWPGDPTDQKGTIRVDGNIRRRIGSGINDKVEVEKADVKEADQIMVAFPDNLQIRGNIGAFVSNNLAGKCVEEGDVVNLKTGFGIAGRNNTIRVQVVDTVPAGKVVVKKSTNVKVADRPAEALTQNRRSEAKKQRKNGDTSTPDVTYEDVGGLEEELDRVREMIELPMRHPELFKRLGIDPPKGVLLHGPPGTGKTLIAKAVANEVNANFQTISGPEIMSKYYGESEEQLRDAFEEASENAPSIIFIDEIDSIAPKRGEATGDVERRVVAQLLSLMDGLEDRGEVIVIGATNRVDALDPALRRGGRFDREIEIGVPDKEGRKEVLQVHTRDMPLAEDVDLDSFAESTHGFVGADLESLTKEAAMTALRRVRPNIDLDDNEIDADLLDSLSVTEEDFNDSMKEIEPSALREVFVEVPDVSWDQVGGLEETKERLRETIQWPLDYPGMFDELDVEAAKGVLLYGPPGTGKTLIAKAVANEANSNFISIKGPELLNKYVGESEKGVREVFSKARENAPTVVFFDEIDSIAGQRGENSGDSGVGQRVVSQLLTELDGLEELEDVVVIATTNRPDLIDSALLRPGRLDRHVHVDVPDRGARRKILEVHTKDKPLGDNVDLDDLARRTEGYVGADIEALCREASMNASREFVSRVSPEEVEERADEIVVTMSHFESALKEVVPSVDDETRQEYDEIEERFSKREIQDDPDSGASPRTFQ